MCQRAELHLQCRPESVAIGRHFLADALARWHVADGDPAWAVLGDVLLVGSELLGNAVRACAGEVTLALVAHHDHVRVVVRDDNPMPATRLVVAHDSPSGRGLSIVAALSSRWGQSQHDGLTKEVWADVDVGPGSVLARGCVR